MIAPMSIATENRRIIGGKSLKPVWRKSTPRLRVQYAGTACNIKLSCGKDVLISGPWALNVQIDGTTALPNSDWEELCWVSDKDVDYLEIEITLDNDLRVQRQIVLARREQFLLLADAVLGSRKVTLDYRGTLPLAQDATFRSACETRDGILAGGKPRATVLPPALPEWLADRRVGELISTGAVLQLRQTGEQSLFAPLFFDLNRRRLQQPLTWRQLTIGESLATQPPHVAAGYRVAIGNRQWLIYRSLTEPKNRTLLGHNLSSETLIARFNANGEVDPLIETE
jgi:hypothetical protein